MREVKEICAGCLIICTLSFFVVPSAAAGTDTSMIDLGTVIVTPSRVAQSTTMTTQQISVVDTTAIEESGAQEVSQVLELLPSVELLDYGALGAYKGVMIRGANTSQVLALVDGRPLNTPRDGLADLTSIPLSQIERIEVLRGPASSMYGANAVGGVINIITKQGTEKMLTELSTRTGAFSTNQVSLAHGYKIRGIDYFLTYDYESSQGHRDNSGYLHNAASVKVGYQLDEMSRLGLSGSFSAAKLGTPGQQSFIDLDDRQDSLKKNVQLTYQGKIWEGQDILLNAFHTTDRLEFNETFAPSVKTTNQTIVYGIDGQISQVFLSVFRTAVGVSLQEHAINSSASDKHDYDFKAFYGEAEVDVTKRVTAKMGLRWDDYSHFGDCLSPSASLSFWLLKSLKLHALVGRSFRAPTFNDLYWPREDWGMWGGVEGNATLGPEKALSFEAGIGGDFLKGRLTTDITLFKTKYEDLIEWTVDDAWWWRPQNVSSAVTKGVEWEVLYRFTERTRAAFNYTYLEAINTVTQKWLIYRPRQTYKVSLSTELFRRCETTFSAVYKTKRFTNEDNTENLKPYATFDMTWIYRIDEAIRAFLEVKNIFDRCYQEERDYPLPGRAFYGGLRIRF